MERRVAHLAFLEGYLTGINAPERVWQALDAVIQSQADVPEVSPEPVNMVPQEIEPETPLPEPEPSPPEPKFDPATSAPTPQMLELEPEPVTTPMTTGEIKETILRMKREGATDKNIGAKIGRKPNWVGATWTYMRKKDPRAAAVPSKRQKAKATVAVAPKEPEPPPPVESEEIRAPLPAQTVFDGRGWPQWKKQKLVDMKRQGFAREAIARALELPEHDVIQMWEHLKKHGRDEPDVQPRTDEPVGGDDPEADEAVIGKPSQKYAVWDYRNENLDLPGGHRAL